MKKLILLFLIYSTHSLAHPVIYKGGWALSSSNMESMSNNYVMYSLNHRLAIGADHWRFTKDNEDSEFGLFKTNLLLWRYNGELSQANIYLHGGFGAHEKRSAHMYGTEVDWESRTLFSALKYYKIQNISTTEGRLGFSPKMTDFDKLQTWFMMRFMHVSDFSETVMITPMVRFFYHNVLWEM